MGRGKIALFTQDERYAGAFSEFCGKNERERITVKTYTNIESLENCLANERIDLLLTELTPAELGINVSAEHVVLLTEDRYIDNDDYPVIYKFQRMDGILKEMYRELSDDSRLADRNIKAGNREPDIIGCYSPCYEEAREQYARVLAERKGKEGRTLFFNFAMFTAFDNEGEEGLSELLYYVSGDDGALGYKLPTLVKYISGYESVPGVKNYLDLCDLDSSVVKKLFDRLKGLSEYKTIIVDIGLVGDIAESIMDYCRELYMPLPVDADNRRVDHMRADYINGLGEGTMGRIRECRLPGWWRDRPERRIKWVSEQYA